MTVLAASGRGMPTPFDYHPLFVEGFLVGFSDVVREPPKARSRLSVNGVSLDATPTNNRRSDYLTNRRLSMGAIAAIQSRGVDS